jgi:hypothetical protein
VTRSRALLLELKPISLSSHPHSFLFTRAMKYRRHQFITFSLACMWGHRNVLIQLFDTFYAHDKKRGDE